MTIVLDATAIIAIIARDSAIATHLEKATRIVVPDLAVAEVLNVRWKYEHAGLPSPTLEAVIGFFERIEILPSLPYAVDVGALSVELDHPAYDCLYATIARRERGRLVTADRKFARKFEGLGIDIVAFTSSRKS